MLSMKIICFVCLSIMSEMCFGTNTISMARFRQYQENDVKLSSNFNFTSVTTSDQCLLTCKLTPDCYSVSYNTESNVNNCELATDLLIKEYSISADGWSIFYTQGSCPSQWTTSEKSCYKLETLGLPYETAKQSCESQPNGHLIDISSVKEHHMVQNLVNAYYSLLLIEIPGIWCGLNDINDEGIFKWSDSSTVETTGFHAWYPGQPQEANDVEDCVSIWAQDEFRWHDDFCEPSWISICEIDIN